MLFRSMDELYNPYYWEDIDLSYRAKKAGYKILFEQKSIVVHKHEKGSVMQNYSPSHTKKIAYRNQFIFIWKNITDTRLLLSHIVWFPVHLVKHALLLDSAYYWGLFMALFRFKSVIHARSKARKTNKLYDFHLISRVV